MGGRNVPNFSCLFLIPLPAGCPTRSEGPLLGCRCCAELLPHSAGDAGACVLAPQPLSRKALVGWLPGHHPSVLSCCCAANKMGPVGHPVCL